ncbi:hypothetical protein [Rhizobium sp. CECT 9324]|uniref:hypothetical protein n=1 Tax=Rhizobium sp. CECT 9324 TaxID=2845820 RepID=UPI001E3A0E2B|nr:hypothetical protein [Rhizobium sp. CECT 9324]
MSDTSKGAAAEDSITSHDMKHILARQSKMVARPNDETVDVMEFAMKLLKEQPVLMDELAKS